MRRVCGAQGSLLLRRSFAAQTRGGWIPVTGTGMTEFRVSCMPNNWLRSSGLQLPYTVADRRRTVADG